MQRETFVLDASVLLHDPNVILSFKGQNIVLPGVVIEELDKIKKHRDEFGKNARQVMRYVDSYVKKGQIGEGIELDGGINFRVVLDSQVKPSKSFPLALCCSRHRTLLTAFNLQEGGERVVVISKDSVMRILAETIGIETRNFVDTNETYEKLYSGIRYIETPKELIDHFYADGFLPLPEGEFYPNEYCVLKSKENSSAVCRVNLKEKKLVPLIADAKRDLWGIKARNVEQRCALDLLQRDDVKLVSFIGQAGTGKTLLALANGLRKVFDEDQYQRIIITRSIMPLGRDIGYLPGTKEEKLQCWLAPFFDNLEFICSSGKDEVATETKKWILESDKLQVEAITYMRGRSISNAYVIIDEAQNLTPHELKTLISRVGTNTKIILLGDPSQIDNPYLDADSNGLTRLVGQMKRYHLYGNIHFRQTERSELAALVAEVL